MTHSNHPSHDTSPLTHDPLYPPSVQSDLFSYLRPEQQAAVRPILRVLKKPAQVELCVALLDYLETGTCDIPKNTIIGGVFLMLTRYNMPDDDDPNNHRIIRPLAISNPHTHIFYL